MRFKNLLVGTSLIMALALGYYFYSSLNSQNIAENTTILSTVNASNRTLETKLDVSSDNTFKLANWNLQIFGDTKASKSDLMNFYVNTLTNYDIVFVQEIRDADGSAFRELCSLLTNYDCQVSSRAGRSLSKEQYGVIYKKGITAQIKDYNPDLQDRWERPPIEVIFNVGSYSFIAYNLHTKPEDVSNEMNNLESIVKTEGNIVILGDLNADCNYYTNEGKNFNSWNWLVKDNQDTTVSSTDCAYDRIILNPDMINEVISSGIYTSQITSDISDHYLVWVEISP